MIQPQELRIGNYIFYKNEIFEVDAISKSHTYLLKGKNIVKTTPECLNPIPLTEEILLKFGFLKDDNFYHLNNIWISNFYENYFSLDGFDETKIEYIHQLQNLYFALTGEELIFKNIP